MSTYTIDEINAYFDHIGLATSWRTSRPSLNFLTELIKLQFATVPFESISLHYSDTHLLSLKPADLFVKIVEHKHGGYCMENNTFFGAILRGLGFNMYSAGARVSDATGGRPGGGYGGWSHMVNIVTIENNRYLVDVGFGADGPTKPLLLDPNHEVVGIAPQLLRVDHKNLEMHTERSQKLWVYSHKQDPSQNWTDAYAFSDIEFFPADFEIMNLSTMTSRSSFFTHSVVCSRALYNEQKGELEGSISIFRNGLKKTLHGNIVEMRTFQTERERVQALKTWFDINLSESEQAAIKGMASEIH